MSEPHTERTLIILKPDCVRRGLMGEVLTRFERRGFRLMAAKVALFNPAVFDQHYAEHIGKAFVPRLRKYMLSGPVFIGVLEGFQTVAQVRKMLGATTGAESLPGTIRGDYCNEIDAGNLVHASDSLDAARREIQIHFPDLS